MCVSLEEESPVQISGMLVLSGLCIIAGIGFVIFGLHQRSRAVCRPAASGGSALSSDSSSTADDMAPLGFLGEGPAPDAGGPRSTSDGLPDVELTGQSKTGVSPSRRTGSLWDSLKAPMRAFKRKEKHEAWRALDIPTATGTALVPKSMKTQPDQPDDGEPSP